MTSESAPSHVFADAPSGGGGALVAAANAVVADAAADPACGTLIVVVHPDATTHRVVGGTGNGVVRAAVSVAAASGNDRVWRDVVGDDTVERSVASLPEVLRATVEGCGVTSVHVGSVRVGGALACAALWFASEAGVADAGRRRGVLQLLTAAAEREHEVEAERAAAAAAVADVSQSSTDSGLPVGSDDPDIDAVTGLASRDRFERAMAAFDGDAATLLLIDLDHFTELNETYGTDAADEVLRETARRLAASCRKTDVAARLEGDRFGLLLVDTERADGLQTARRLLAAIAEPLPSGIGPDHVTTTIALAHQDGLVDIDEMFEGAADAITSGKRTGRARIVVAS